LGKAGRAPFELYPGICLTTEEKHGKPQPLLVIRAENPRALKDLLKGTLPVIWKSNSEAWVTATISEDWFSHHFVPEVKNIVLIIIFLSKEKLPRHTPWRRLGGEEV
jgi:hypothetical protein